MTTVHLENANTQLQHLLVMAQSELLIERLRRMLQEKGEKLTRTDLENTISETLGIEL